MEGNFDRSLRLVLKHEGGFVNHPRDPGGATNKGVTLATFRRFVNPRGTIEDLKSIPDAQLRIVYRRQFWDACNCGLLPAGVDHAVFDFAVNSGPARAARFAQGVAGAEQDGRIADQSIKAISRMPRARFINRLCDERLAFLQRLATWPTFGTGWTRRVEAVRNEATKMATEGAKA